MDENSTANPNISGTQSVASESVSKKDWIQEMCEREATPKAAREGTIESFCKKWGISESTYGYQKRLKENKKKIVEIWLNEASNGGNEVLAKLKDNALEGKEKSIEMYLKFVLELAENLDITSGGKPIVLPSEIIKQYAPDGITKTDSE